MINKLLKEGYEAHVNKTPKTDQAKIKSDLSDMLSQELWHIETIGYLIELAGRGEEIDSIPEYSPFIANVGYLLQAHVSIAQLIHNELG